VGLGIWFVWSGQLSKKQNVGLANPASVFCVDNGGRIAIMTDESGAQFGECIFADNKSCEEWAYFRGECGTKEGTTAVLNQKILNGGIYITPLQVVSDSRCPADVECIWAGEILIKVKLEKNGISKEIELKEGGTVTFEGNNISLASVNPKNKATSSTIQDYQFTFKVTTL
jgi:putative hemolysin